jgi:probable rRNA maturation factor
MMELLFTRRNRRAARGGDARRLKQVVRMTLEMENMTERTVSILLTDDREIHEINLEWRHKDKPTDVLAFAYDEASDADIIIPGQMMPLGDLIISVETAKRQADSRKVSLNAELELLAVHGSLHLLGYDHAAKEEARIMRNRTRVIRNALKKHLKDS